MNISPETYKNMAAQHVRLKSMKQGQFVQWAVSFWQEAYNEGFSEAENKYTQDGINVSEDVDAQVLDMDSLREILLSVKGIGNTLATRILNTITEEMQ